MAKFAKKIHENNEILLIKKFIRIFRSKQQHYKKRRFSFVLTGGDSPIKLYKFLAKYKKINWKNVDFFIGDERFVKETLKNSFLFTNITFLLFFLLILFLNNEAMCPSLPIPKRTISNLELLFEKYSFILFS